MNQPNIIPGKAVDKRLTRESVLRRLLGVGFLGWLGAILYPIAKYLVPPPVGEANVTSMKVGSLTDAWEQPFKIIQFGRKPVIVFKDRLEEIHALSATCTHLACIVQFQDVDNIVWCACHNAKFDLSGKVISGPPPAPLEAFDVNITDNGEIWVSRKQV